MAYALLDENFKRAESPEDTGIEDHLGPHWDAVMVNDQIALLVSDDCLMRGGAPLASIAIHEGGGKTALVRGPACLIRVSPEGQQIDPPLLDTEIDAVLQHDVEIVKVKDINGAYYIVGADGNPRRHPSIPYCYFLKTDIVS